jgi:outer membrane protein assembly factor BamE
MKIFRILIVGAFALLLLSGCLRVYKIDVQQGNDLSEKQLAALEVGLNRQEVRALLGTPLIDDPFRQDRWDYYYTFKEGRSKEVTRRRLTLFFDENVLARVEGLVEPETVRTEPVDVEALGSAGDSAQLEAENEEQRTGFWARVGAAIRGDEGQAE